MFTSILLFACSTKKNTKTTRSYHAINTKYNIYFNADESYKEALKTREESYIDTLSQMLEIYPIYPAKVFSSEDNSSRNEQNYDNSRGIAGFSSSQSGNSSQYSSLRGGSFSRSIEKNTKAIKLHSIKSKPERNPNKRRDPKYQAWLQQQEFNPFMHNAWLLLGKSEYQDGDYLQAASTFSYMTKIYKTNPEIVAEARMWMAKSNIAMGWIYEAEDIFNQMRLAGGIPDRIKPEYNKIYADFLLRKEEYTQAIPFLEAAIKTENNRLQKTRMKYLLGQLYKHEGNREMAYKAFESVHGLSTPYLYSFNARIQQASFVDETNKEQILKMLNKMTKDHKNRTYLDQVYYAIGNIYLNEGDTARAVENYHLSLKRSTRKGHDKGLTSVVLGDIYFTKRDYIKAQPIYSDALGTLSKRHEDYPTVALRSAVLDELVVHAKAVHLQDSLQTLARMPEEERMQVIHNLIEDLKKKEREKQKEAQREEMLANREQTIPAADSPFFEQNAPNIPTAPIAVGDAGGAFYFYNTQLVDQGKASFQRKWGVRKLEDNWRRRNKQMSFVEEESEVADSDESDQATEKDSEQVTGVNNMYSPEFYLQQIPLTPEAIEASNVIIEDAYFNMGKIYKDKLVDYPLAIEAFETDLRRFPETPNLEEIYYQLFLIYLKQGNKNMIELYRQNILNSFPESNYAAALRDNNYEWNMLNMYRMEDDFYRDTYASYLSGDIANVRQNYQEMKEKYPLSGLMPKFMFINSLTYAQENDADGFKDTLTELVMGYPKSDVTPLASDMLKGLISGRPLSSDSSPFRGMIWEIKFQGDTALYKEGVEFTANAGKEHMLMLVYKKGSIDKNQLIYEVANYNFSNYVYQTFDLSFADMGQIEMLQVKGFDNLDDIISYIDKAFEPESLMDNLDPSIIPVPISNDNYIALMNGKTLNQYFIFFEENYTQEMLTLIRYWNQQKEGGEDSTENTRIEEDDKEQVVGNEEIKLEPQPIPVDTIKPITPQEIPQSSLLPDRPKQTDSGKTQTEIGLGDIIPDEQIDKADDAIGKATDVFNNPVDGLKGLFKSSGETMTKEEKEAEKQAEKLKKEQEKERKQEQKALEKLEREAEKARLDSISNAEKSRVESEKALDRAKQEERKNAEKLKEDSRKEQEKEKREKEKAHKEEQKRKEKERNDELKRKERERKDRLKERERERKEKLKQRDAELKQRERQLKRNK